MSTSEPNTKTIMKRIYLLQVNKSLEGPFKAKKKINLLSLFLNLFN